MLHESCMRDFYYNMVVIDDGSLNTQVGNYLFHLNVEILGDIVDIPKEGIK